MNNIMLDIETLGTGVDSVVIQVAMIKFDRDGTLGESLSVRLNRDEQLKLGLSYTQSTLDWWNKTNPELLKTLLTENVSSLNEGLTKISNFVSRTDYLWCHATFDAPILSNLFEAAGMKAPWGYKNVRDIRTLVDLTQLNLSDYNWVAEKTHDALDDCRFQIKYCCDAFKRI